MFRWLLELCCSKRLGKEVQFNRCPAAVATPPRFNRWCYNFFPHRERQLGHHQALAGGTSISSYIRAGSYRHHRLKPGGVSLFAAKVVLKFNYHRLKPGGVSLSHLRSGSEVELTVILPRSCLFGTNAEFGCGKGLLISIALNPADNGVYAWCVLEKLHRRSKGAV